MMRPVEYSPERAGPALLFVTHGEVTDVQLLLDNEVVAYLDAFVKASIGEAPPANTAEEGEAE